MSVDVTFRVFKVENKTPQQSGSYICVVTNGESRFRKEVWYDPNEGWDISGYNVVEWYKKIKIE